MFHLVECPRDAMQGWPHFIPTQQKIEYINSLLQVGFHTLDCGSFVSQKAIPQMADTAEVISNLEVGNSKTKLLVIVANKRGAEVAVQYRQVSFLGFPFSISPTFQQRNTNSSIEESVQRVDEIQELCLQHNKQLVIYLSMGFGNPYGDEYNEDVLLHWADVMVQKNISVISVADTVGIASAQQIKAALQTLITAYPNTEIGVHLHSTALNWQQKMDAALAAGCTRFDGALKGIGGCPMAKDELIGNMSMEWMINHLEKSKHDLTLDEEALKKSLSIADKIFV